MNGRTFSPNSRKREESHHHHREEEVGRQHQGMDRPGVRQVPEGSGEQGKMEKTGCKIICGAPTTLAVKGLMMMMTIKEVRHSQGMFHETREKDGLKIMDKKDNTLCRNT